MHTCTCKYPWSNFGMRLLIIQWKKTIFSHYHKQYTGIIHSRQNVLHLFHSNNTLVEICKSIFSHFISWPAVWFHSGYEKNAKEAAEQCWWLGSSNMCEPLPLPTSPTAQGILYDKGKNNVWSPRTNCVKKLVEESRHNFCSRFHVEKNRDEVRKIALKGL